MDTGARSARNELFQELKPYCIELSQLALQDADNTKGLIQAISQLLAVLEAKCQRTDGIFDTKLADYVFFPLSQILLRKKKYTDRLSELTIKCIRILLQYGWRTGLALDLSRQLLILLTFVAGGIPGKDSSTPPEELVAEAYRALAALFDALAVTPGGSASLVESGTIPALGHCVSVILDGISDGSSADVHLAGLCALRSAWKCVKDAEALASFLPGTISTLTKCLMPSTTIRRTRKTLIKGLEVLGLVLTSLLSDIRTITLRKASTTSEETSSSSEPGKTITPSWLKASTGQIKLALANTVRLRNHEHEEVRSALNVLCITLLDECHDTLSESASMLVETCMTLAGGELDPGVISFSNLATIRPDLGELVKTTVYNWVTSLPRIMQANDENAKRLALDQLSKAHSLFASLSLESPTLSEALANSLRDSVTVTLESTSGPKVMEEPEFNLNSEAAITLTSSTQVTTYFHPIIMAAQSQRLVRDELEAFLSKIGTKESQISMASDMLSYSRSASGSNQVSAFWLSSRILKSASTRDSDLDEFLGSALTMSDELESVNQELFSQSLSLLVDAEEDIDWRLRAIALEVVASTAQRLKEDFRTELIDALYPITQLIGSPNSSLRSHAITCLNIVSSSCGYANASELIVENVDYMVNAISLRLNTFDISPQAPQVLVMMIRLTGPKLLLYLDDVVGSIFAALDNFHGYQMLVDSLFGVLGEIVNVGAKSTQLQIEDTKKIDHKKKAPEPTTVEEILALITPKSNESDNQSASGYHKAPQIPWKSVKALLDERDPQPANSSPQEEKEDEPEQATEVAPAPPTKTFTLLQSITSLSQHYLTSPSPQLRSKLLSLIRTSSIALSASEHSFLPLVNDIWPVIITRLHDNEAFVRISAMETVGVLCSTAGDFLSTRIASEWQSLTKLARQARTEVDVERQRGNSRTGGKGGAVANRGVYSQASKVWEAVVGLLVAIVGHVCISDEAFGDVLEVLGDVIVERTEVREVLETINADAVWLQMLIRGGLDGERVRLEQDAEKLSGVEAGWEFVSPKSLFV